MAWSANHQVIPPLRAPERVMRLERMGASFQTRLSFMRQLIRRMHRERWRFERLRFDLDAAGYGTAVYAAHGPQRTYSLIAYTHEIGPKQRTDRVIAEAWGCHVLVLRRRAGRCGYRAVARQHTDAGGGPLHIERAHAGAGQQEHAPVRACRRTARRRPTARGRPAGRRRLSDAHHGRLRERQVRLRRPREDRGPARDARSPFRPRCSPST